MKDIDIYFDKLETLIKIKDLYSWSEEIPERMVHSSEVIGGEVVVPKFKVRSGWWATIYAITDYGLSFNYFSSNVKREYEALQDYVDKTDFRHRLTTKEDIKKANGLLELIFEEEGVVYSKL